MSFAESLVFNKEKFAQLLKKAQGSRTQNQYQYDARVSSTYIGKLLKCKTDVAPSPDVIKKLASVAEDGITYQELMEAAGHIKMVGVNEISENAARWEPVKEEVSNYLVDNKTSLVKAIAISKNISTEASEKLVQDFLDGFGNLPKEKQIKLISAIVSSVKIVKGDIDK